jgi:hypothetical protein
LERLKDSAIYCMKYSRSNDKSKGKSAVFNFWISHYRCSWCACRASVKKMEVFSMENELFILGFAHEKTNGELILRK